MKDKNVKAHAEHAVSASSASHRPASVNPSPANPCACKRDIGLILAIIFASAAISGSLVYFGMQMGGKGGDVQVETVEKAFENFAKKQQGQQVEEQQKAEAEQDKIDQEKAQNVKKVTAEDHIYGNKDAKITLIEYSDFECPYCKVFDGIAKQLMTDYNGQINWVYRHYPLSFHEPMATKEAEASECVAELGGNDKFWVFVDEVYKRTKSGGNGLTEDDIYAIVGDIGVSVREVKACLASGKYTSKVQQDMLEAEAAGVTGTPGNILINNETGAIKAVHGARKISVFKDAIDAMLK
jgi:protein-disulfide isomerase